jgi:hypothetical protein
MHIEEVEAIWSAIDEQDNWQPFIDKVKTMGVWAGQWSRMHQQAKEGSEPVGESWPLASWFLPILRQARSGPARSEMLLPKSRLRAAWPAWAAHSNAYRIEAARRFANVVRAKENEFAELIARRPASRCGKRRPRSRPSSTRSIFRSMPMRSGRRSGKWRQLGNKIAVRHKPHGVLAVLGPYNFPAHLPTATSSRH